MLRYETLKENPHKFLTFTGLTPKEFEHLLLPFARAYARQHPSNKTGDGHARTRQAGGGRRGALESLEQKLLFILVYQKAYPLQAVHGELFGLSQSRANRWIHQLLPLLEQALDTLRLLPERDPRRFARRAQQESARPELIIDGTERRRPRPKNREKQALHYSGKKKAHTDKNVIIVNAKTKRIGFLSQTYPGKMHDKKIADTEQISYPRTATLHKDSGFQAYEPRVRQTYQPKKSRAAKS